MASGGGLRPLFDIWEQPSDQHLWLAAKADKTATNAMARNNIETLAKELSALA